jgi:lipopolysaccharide biosynthesis regulator YciM
MDHPARARVAEIVVSRVGKESTRGSGYLVSPGWVLTAYHVVKDAVSVGVWLGAPAELAPEAGVGVDGGRVLAVPGADLALLPLGGPVDAPRCEPALLGRLDREPGLAVPVAAAGYPRFKLRPAPARPGVLLRDLTYAIGSIAVLSDAKTGRFAFAVDVPPGADPEPDEHSPWEGMSGAAVWASGRLVGVVGQHHPREGPATLTVCPVRQLFGSASADQLAAWRSALPRLPATAADLRLATPPTVRKIEVRRARLAAEALAPRVMIGRSGDLAALEAFSGSDERWRWIQADAFAGKTALLAWFTLHPPELVDVVACFLRRAGGDNTVGNALRVLNRQLALLADQRGYPESSSVFDRVSDFADLLGEAARACAERGRKLVVLIDGLDEYDPTTSNLDLADWLPDDGKLPDQAMLVAASRAGADVSLPPRHPLLGHVHRIAASEVATEIQYLAREEIGRALTVSSGFISPIVGCLAVADGGLTASELHALLKLRGRDADVSEIQTLLSSSLGRSLMRLPDPDAPSAPGSNSAALVFVFAHETLLTEAREKFAGDLAAYEDRFDQWADQFVERDWPVDTPRYLLAPYTRDLARRARGLGISDGRSGRNMSGALDRLVSFATDAVRQDRMLAYTSGDAAALTEITTGQQLIRAQPAPDLAALGRLAVYRNRLATRNRVIPRGLPAVWVRLGQVHRGEAVARSSSNPESLASALAELAKALAGAGQYDRAEETAHSIADPKVEAEAISAVAAAIVEHNSSRAESLIAEAQRIAGGITDRRSRAAGLIAVAESAVTVNRDLTLALVRNAEDSLQGVLNSYHIERIRTQIAKVAALAGESDDDIQGTVQAISDKSLEVWVWSVVVQAFAETGQLDRAKLAAQRIGEFHNRAAATYSPSVLGSGRRAATPATPHQIAFSQASAFAALAKALALAEPNQAVVWAAAAEDAARSIEDAEALTAVIPALAVTGHWNHAEEAANDVLDPELKVNGLVAIANAVITVDDAKARALMTTAEQLTHTIASREAAARALTGIADAALGFDMNWAAALAEAAEATARSGGRPEDRDKILTATMEGLAAAKDWDHAEHAASAIGNPLPRDQALAALADHLATAGDLDRAESVGQMIERSTERDKVYAAIAESLATAGNWDHAEDATSKIESRNTRDEALATAALRLAAAGKLDCAKDAIRATDSSWRHSTTLTSIGDMLIETRQWDSAATLVDEAEYPETQATILCRMGKALADIDHYRALRSVDEARQIIDAITDKEFRSMALEELAGAFTVLGEWNRAQETISTIPYGSDRASARLVEALIAAAEWDRAELTARGISDKATLAESLTQLGTALIDIGQDRGLLLIAEAEDIARNAHSLHTRPQALCAVTRALARGGQWDRATEFMLGVSNPSTRARALRELIGVLVAAGDWERANEIAKAETGLSRDVGAVAFVDALVAASKWELAVEATDSISIPEDRAAAKLRVVIELMADKNWETKSADRTLSTCARRLLAETLAEERWLEAISPLGKFNPPAVMSIYIAARGLGLLGSDASNK